MDSIWILQLSRFSKIGITGYCLQGNHIVIHQYIHIETTVLSWLIFIEYWLTLLNRSRAFRGAMVSISRLFLMTKVVQRKVLSKGGVRRVPWCGSTHLAAQRLVAGKGLKGEEGKLAAACHPRMRLHPNQSDAWLRPRLNDLSHQLLQVCKHVTSYVIFNDFNKYLLTFSSYNSGLYKGFFGGGFV